MERSLQYTSLGRGGYLVYTDDISSIKLDYEFGGGNCVAIIFVPTPDEWVAQTNRSLSDRKIILTFVAEQAIKDQVPGGNYTLSDRFIEIFN